MFRKKHNLHGVQYYPWCQASTAGLGIYPLWIRGHHSNMWSDNEVLVAQSCPTLCKPMDCSPPGSSVYGFLQARILKWIAIPFSRGSSRSRDQTRGSSISGRFFTIWATGKILRFNPKIYLGLNKIKLFIVSLCINVFSLKNTYICLMLVFLQNVLIEIISVR